MRNLKLMPRTAALQPVAGLEQATPAHIIRLTDTGASLNPVHYQDHDGTGLGVASFGVRGRSALKRAGRT